MTTYVALLRAVNVGGKAVLMAAVRTMMSGAGLDDVRTLMQSGNAVFASNRRSARDLERLLEIAAGDALGLQTEFFVRSAQEWQDGVAANPFPAEAKRDPAHLAVVVLKAAPAAGDVASLQAAIVGRETVRAGSRHLYIVYPDGMGNSRLTLGLIERKLRTTGTARNWNTVLKLQALLS
jgi:uncharacterized protein (DUF1697 family)